MTREKFRKSVNKPNHGPVIEWHGGDCPVPAGTLVSIMTRYEHERGHGYWRALNRPETWPCWKHTGSGNDVLAYYVRLPTPRPPTFGQASPQQGHNSIPLPNSRMEALAMRAIAETWLAENAK